MNNEEDPHEFWNSLPEDRREMLDQSARNSFLQLPRYPYWDLSLCQELLAWSQLETDILTGYNRWLSGLERRAESQGREWNRTEFLRQTRLREVGE